MKLEELVSINMNSNVYLLLEEKDFIHWHKHYNDVLPAHVQDKYPLQSYKDIADKETGLVKMQIHTFISVFSDMHLGGFLPARGRMFFDTKEFLPISDFIKANS